MKPGDRRVPTDKLIDEPAAELYARFFAHCPTLYETEQNGNPVLGPDPATRDFIIFVNTNGFLYPGLGDIEYHGNDPDADERIRRRGRRIRWHLERLGAKEGRDKTHLSAASALAPHKADKLQDMFNELYPKTVDQ